MGADMARSKALEKWFQDQSKDVEKAKENLSSLPANLQKELEREARNDSRVSKIAAARVTGVNIMLIRAYLDQPGIVKPASLNLPGLREGFLPTSNWLENTALFGVAPMKRRKNEKFKRNLLQDATIFSREGAIVQYSGEQLYQFDWDVLHYLILKSCDEFDKWFYLTPSEILENIGLAKNQSAYGRLMDSLKRLSQSSLFIAIETEGMSLTLGKEVGNCAATVLHLIRDFVWQKDLKSESMKVVIDSRMTQLFDHNMWGQVNQEQRKALRGNDLAKKLQCLFSTQQANKQIHRFSRLQTITGLTENIYFFSRSLGQSLDNLVDVGCISAYWISKPKRGKQADKRLIIWKTGEASPNEPIPRENGTYFCKRGKFVTAEDTPPPYPITEVLM